MSGDNHRLFFCFSFISICIKAIDKRKAKVEKTLIKLRIESYSNAPFLVFLLVKNKKLLQKAAFYVTRHVVEGTKC